jgi:hypothetical protein
MYYRLAGKAAPKPILSALEWIAKSISQSARCIQDDQRMEEILRIDPEILCSRLFRPGDCDSGSRSLTSAPRGR